TVSVTFDENFEGGAKTETNFLASATILANAPDVSARDGWTFAGWFDATEGGNQISATDLPTDGATYYAHWTPGPDQIAAGAAAALIAAIGDVAYTDESKAKIDAARAAYDALTPAQQALVGNYATLAAAEEAYAALVPAPWGCYQVLSESDITAPYAAPKAATLAGAVYDGCDVVGIVNLRLGKVNAKKKTGKVSGSVTLLDGKKRTIKSVSVTGIDGVSPKSVALSVKGLGTMNVTIGGTRFAGSLGGYHVQSAAVGGKWTRADAKVYVAFGGAALPAGTIEDLLPDGEPVIPRGGKWAFGKASSVKYAKDAKTKVLTLTVNDRNGTARNRSAMKLSYNPKTGVFKGSFKVYAIQGGKLKKITAKVNGVVADGDGHGRATIQKSGVFPVTVE
ncbi:MAG: InlB B-repeat-containing protein, partial [Kiritimatiellae bacterium]|nr:InlB B-repeat-containing protein [Kiritimatiellia bacterium]